MSVAPATSERAAELRAAYDEIASEVEQAGTARGTSPQPRLVAVSKLKPSGDIQALFEHGVRHFGENYPQELESKAKELSSEIQWHFIGALQSNKCKMLAAIPNLFAIETLSSTKSANLLQKALASQSPPREEPLNVYLQVNTSDEDAKSGVTVLSDSTPDPKSSELYLLALHVVSECPNLRLKGLMTIGSFDSSTSSDPNPDFANLDVSRQTLLKMLVDAKGSASDKAKAAIEELEARGLEMSCGMSEDFVQAIKQGSSSVRVGSRIFGARPKRQ
ncbi:hypothetical protein T439DRAFT_320485 [Meredithblackwellia eburnea MCA 4105]